MTTEIKVIKTLGDLRVEKVEYSVGGYYYRIIVKVDSTDHWIAYSRYCLKMDVNTWLTKKLKDLISAETLLIKRTKKDLDKYIKKCIAFEKAFEEITNGTG